MVIPGYKIISTLGKGGMATVYLAIQESFDRKVAIKVMSTQLAADPAFGERFQREARIVSQMNHPNIVTVYDVGVVDNHHYLAMQYVEGRELRYRFNQLGLPEKIRIIKEIASALNYAGNKGYVHRDVKPENVMLSDEDGRAILMDFGIAKTTSDTNHSMTKTGTAIGTPYYMSPEQAQGKPVDKRTDIYSLGVMFFQMLTGRVPYDAESQVAIGIKHITEPVPSLPRHLQVFQPIIDKVMAKRPEDRYQTGAEFIRDLEKISAAEIEKIDAQAEAQAVSATTDPNAVTSQGEATPAPTAGHAAVSGAVPAASNKKPVIAMAAVVAVLVILAGAWFALHKKETPPPAPVAVVSAPAPQPAPPVSPPATPVAPPAPAAEAPAETPAASTTTAVPETAQAAPSDAEKPRAHAPAETKPAAQRPSASSAVDSRLARAESLASEGQLVGSDDDNALAVYRSVLALDPGNARATRGVRETQEAYLAGIRHQIDSGNLESATGKLREANRLLPNNSDVGELLALLQKKKEQAAAQKADSTSPRISRVLVSDTDFEAMGGSQKSSLPLSRTAYVGFSYQNFEGATTLVQAVLYDSSRTVKLVQKPIVAPGAQGSVFFSLSRPVEGFSDGAYSLDLLIDDQKMASLTFTVAH